MNGFIVEPGRVVEADEELAPVRVRAGVRHGQRAEAAVDEVKILVRELLAVDRLAARAVLIGKIAALAHEAGDDAVEGRALVAEALGTRAELLEVLAGLRRRVACAHINQSGLSPRRRAGVASMACRS